MFSALWECSPGAPNKTWDLRTSQERSSKPRTKKRRELAARTKNTRQSLHEDTFYVTKITQQCVSIVICTAEPQKLGAASRCLTEGKKDLSTLIDGLFPRSGRSGQIEIRSLRTFPQSWGRSGSSLPNCHCRANHILLAVISHFLSLLLHRDDSRCRLWSRPQP